MSDFEEYIKLNYPRDYERQKRIYPDQSMEDLYSEDYKMWQHQQAIIDDLIYKAKLRESDHQALLVKYQATKKCWDDMGKECESLKAQLNKHSECIENLVNQKADYLDRVTKAIAHLDSFDLSQVGMNKLQRSIESALEALRGEE